MKSRNAIFLMIGSIFWILFDLNGILYRNLATDYGDSWFIIAATLLILLIPAGFILLGFTSLKPSSPANSEQSRRKLAVVFTILSILSVIVILCFRVFYFNSGYLFEDPFRFALDHILILFPVSIMMFWINFVNEKAKKGAVWLLVGALISCFSIFSDKVSMTFTYGYDFDRGTWETISQLLRFANILYPASLVVFALSILREQKKNVPAMKQVPYIASDEMLDNLPSEPEIIVKSDVTKEIPTVIDWISDFLAAMIPLFGIGFLVWRGQNKEDTFRRNWAVATLFWTIIGSMILLFMYFPIFMLVERLEVIFWISALLLVALFIVWTLLVKKVNNDDFDAGDEDENSPVLGWVGRVFVASLPVAGLICLIVWAIDEDNRERKNWAIARLIWIGVTAAYWLFLYSAFLEIVAYGNRFTHFQF